ADAVTDLDKRKKFLVEERKKRLEEQGLSNRTEVLARADLLKTAVEMAGKERERRLKELTAVKRLQDDDRAEVRVAVRAEPPPDAAGSNFKKLAAATFAAMVLLLFGGLIVTDRVANSSTPRNVSERLGLPVLATLAPGGGREKAGGGPQ